jgi:hypothetical protein
MKQLHKRLFLPLCFSLLSLFSFDSFAGVPWQDILPSQMWLQPSDLQLSDFRSVGVNMDTIEQNYLTDDLDSLSSFAFPLPDGTELEFLIWLDPILPSGLAATYPDIRTYSGICATDPSLRIKLDIGAYGMHGMVIGPETNYFLDPATDSRKDVYITYSKEQAYVDNRHCTVSQPVTYPSIGPSSTSNPALITSQSFTLGHLRSYRIAISTTSSYGIFRSGSDFHILSSLVTQIHRVNGVFERDVNIRFVFAEGTDQLFFKDPSSDPFTVDSLANASILAMDNQNAMGSFNDSLYDLGICFSTLEQHYSNGLVCTMSKNKASFGVVNKLGSPIDLVHLAHALGHMVGANHTNNSNCNRVGTAAFEPGSGSSIMARTGYCFPSIQESGDAYFHIHNIFEMHEFVTNGPGASCGRNSMPSFNLPPLALLPSDVVYIPPSTPLRLYPDQSFDPDGQPVTYCWEQYNLGPPGHPNMPSGSAPIIRSRPPSKSNVRFIPELLSIVKGTQQIGEMLPDYSRNLRFRLTMRDNNMMDGGVSYQQLDMSVLGNVPPFEVQYPMAGQSFSAQEHRIISWNVGATSDSLINCQKVNIYLSLDSGYTFDHTLALNEDNDGHFTWFVPDGFESEQARLMIVAADQYFFALSDIFEITEAISLDEEYGLSTFSVFPNPWSGDGVLRVAYNDPNLHTQSLDLKLDLSSANGQLVWSGNKTMFTELGFIELESINLPPGVYLLRIQVNDGGNNSKTTSLKIFRN